MCVVELCKTKLPFRICQKKKNKEHLNWKFMSQCRYLISSSICNYISSITLYVQWKCMRHPLRQYTKAFPHTHPQINEVRRLQTEARALFFSFTYRMNRNFYVTAKWQTIANGNIIMIFFFFFFFCNNRFIKKKNSFTIVSHIDFGIIIRFHFINGFFIRRFLLCACVIYLFSM